MQQDASPPPDWPADYVRAKRFAELTGCNRSTITRQIERGILRSFWRNGAELWIHATRAPAEIGASIDPAKAFGPAVRDAVDPQRMRDTSESPPPDSDNEIYRQARGLNEWLKLQRALREEEQARGELIPRKDVNDAGIEAGKRLDAELRNGLSSLAARLSVLSDEREIRAVLSEYLGLAFMQYGRILDDVLSGPAGSPATS
ncbi:MAG: hypothetical protein WCF85_16880 [Rhodospirillaceae bacterium]